MTTRARLDMFEPLAEVPKELLLVLNERLSK
jgi:hypothetical protein